MFLPKYLFSHITFLYPRFIITKVVIYTMTVAHAKQFLLSFFEKIFCKELSYTNTYIYFSTNYLRQCMIYETVCDGYCHINGQVAKET